MAIKKISINGTQIDTGIDTHTHGSITNAGAITTSVEVANGDAIVITDASASHAVKKTSITFDGSTETAFLSKKGTWVESGMKAPDFTNQIASVSPGTEYTITQECFAILYGGTYGEVRIDGGYVFGNTGGSWGPNPSWFYLKPGMKFKCSGSTSTYSRLYGLK